MTSGSRSSADRAPEPSGISDRVLAAIEEHLKERERRREEVYGRARKLRRAAQSAVSQIHGGASAEETVRPVRDGLAELAAALRGDGRADEPLALDALQEGVEACLLAAIVAESPLPGPSELGVDPEPYLLGLGDVVGEIRRLLLDRLGDDDLPAAERHLTRMERLTEALLRFDTARAIVQLKPKQDQARILLERTRGEVVMARLLIHARDGREARP